MDYIYVDTGAMYRAIGVFFLINSVDIEDEEACKSVLDRIMVSIRYREGVQEVLLNGVNVSPIIRTEEVSHAASLTSSYASVREKLLSLQQKLAEENDVVMDGRDIGTVVLPNAEVKIYLTASVEVRAMRRFKELQAKGEKDTFESVLENLKKRDYIDSHRAKDPLTKAKDAIELDNSSMSLEDEIEWLNTILLPNFNKHESKKILLVISIVQIYIQMLFYCCLVFTNCIYIKIR